MNQNKLGTFITLEGLDGVGKTTHIEFIKNYIEDHGFKTFLTREPGGTEVGEKLREILLFYNETIHKNTELFLMFASRQELISNVIIPKLNENYFVISDRFLDSSYAYQGGGRKIDINHIEFLTSMLNDFYKPDLTLLFNASINNIFQRISGSTQKDRIEKENLEFFQRVQDVYFHLQQQDPARIHLISTDCSKEITQEHIKHLLDNLLNHKLNLINQ